MIIAGCKKNKCVYVYEFPDRSAYVGITTNIQRRTSDRKRRPEDTVTRYINESGLIPIHKQLTEFIPVEEAVFLEAKFVEEYKNHNWHILNKLKTGGVGGDILYWTKEKCFEEALKFNMKSDFNLHSKGAYCSARYNGWLPEMYSHMKPFQRQYWTKERCQSETLKYNTKSDFRKNSRGAYDSAKRNKWFDELCSHMIIPIKKIWTIEECKQEALKYISKYDFRTNSNKIYEIARKNKWLKECCKHIKRKVGSGGHGHKRKWTIEMCLESALKCERLAEWRKKDKNAYNIARKYGWFKDCTKHMEKGTIGGYPLCEL
jgi:predicted GIY-YIG superfamily endonuclease